MSYNKKGLKALALGTVLSFGLTGLAALPASAATTGVTFKPNGDSTSLNTTLSSTFELNFELTTTAKGLAVEDLDKLKFQVVQSEDGTINADEFTDGGSTIVTTNYNYDDSGVVFDLSTDSTTSVSATVTAWLDGNNDGKINDDFKSDAVKVNFLAASDIKASVSLDTPAIGDDHLYATATTTPALNGDFTNDLTIDFDGTESGTLTFTDGQWSGEASVAPIVKDETYSAQLLADGDEVGTAASKKSAVVDTVEYVTLTLVEGANAMNEETDEYSEIRTDKGATLVVTARNKYGLPIGAGVRVTTTVDSSDVYVDSAVVKVGGKTISNDGYDSSITLSGVTDSKGTISYAITTNTDSVDGDDFEVNASAQGVSNYLYVEWNDAYVVVTDQNDQGMLDDNNSYNWSDERLIKDDGSVTFDFLVTDQYKQPFKYAKLEYDVWDDDDNKIAADVLTASAAGKISLKVTDSQRYGYDLDYVYVNFEAGKSSSNIADSWSDDFYFYNYSSAAGVDFDGSAYVEDGYNVSTFAFADRNRSTSTTNAVFNPDSGSRQLAWIDIDTNTYGAPVTFSAPGLLFVTGDGTYFKDKVTVISYDENAGVYVASRTIGEKTVNITTLGDKATAKVEFYSEDLNKFTLNVPAVTASGRALNLQVSGTDVNGNDVFDADYGQENLSNVDYTLTGNVGYLTNTIDDRAAWIIGASDRGAASVTAKYTDSNSDDWSVTKKSLVGVTASIVKPAAGATVTVKYAKGATIKVVRGTKSISKVATLSTQKVVLKAGTGTVRVYVNGIWVASK